MYKGHQIVVVVPAHNEETQILRVLTTMPSLVDRIVVIDDCSADKTSDIVTSQAAVDPRIVLIRHTTNTGVGGAIATGYIWARDNDCDVAVVMAGDGQMDPDDMPALLDPVVVDGVHYAKGDRLTTGEAFRKIPKVRFFGNAVLSLLTKIASGYWHVSDSQSGYTAISRAALHALDWDRMYKRYGQPNHLLTMLNVMNFRVRDVPIKPIYGVGERSGIRIHRVLFTISALLVRCFLWRMSEKYVIRDFHPLVFFYAFGAFLMLFSTVIAVRLVILFPIIGRISELSAMTMLICFAMAMQSIFFAMWFDMEKNRDLR